MTLSYWEHETYFKNIDIAIIGSGIVGLNAAIYLKRKNKKLKIIILERGFLPTGASSKNAGFACFGSASELLDDCLTHTEDEVFSLVEKRWNGLQLLRKNLGDKAIHFDNYGGYEVFNNRHEYNRCYEKLEYLNRNIESAIGLKKVFKNADSKIKTFGFLGISNMILNSAEGQINTGEMMKSLIAKVRSLGIEIINGMEINGMEENEKNVQLKSSNNIEIPCKHCIVATNGFARQLLPELNVVPSRGQVLITQPIRNLKFKGTFHFDSGYYYFRNVGNRVLLGGGRNLDFKNEETTTLGITQKIQNKLEELLQTIILPTSEFNIERRWSGIMGLGPQKKTIVKSLSNNIHCAVRLGGMGVAIGSLIGEEVAQLVINKME